MPLGNLTNDITNYFYTVLLINRPLGMPDVLSVTWTLFIEVSYYF